jgi:hypothetical protein
VKTALNAPRPLDLVIRLIILAYPPEFRRRYSQELLMLIQDIRRDSQSSPPAWRVYLQARALSDLAGGAIYERLQALLENITAKDTPVKTSQSPSFYRRHRQSLLITGAALTALIVSSVILGFWSYGGPGGYAVRVVQIGQAAMRYEGNWNAGWDDVTANFVADYVAAKYHDSGRTDVGYKSPHAASQLEAATKETYSSMEPSFDPVLCSQQAPTSVKYIRERVTQPGYASIVAAFGYSDGSPTNLVRYDLDLDLSKSKQGDWKISQIQCLSLDAMPSKPYVNRLDVPTGAAPGTAPYSQRNDRTF